MKQMEIEYKDKKKWLVEGRNGTMWCNGLVFNSYDDHIVILPIN